MDASEIIHQLISAEGLPTEALKVATERRERWAPVLIGEIENYLALESGSAARSTPNPLFLAFHLLGEWREKSAYRPLARFLQCPGPEVDAILGDGITLTSHRVMAAVFDGDPQPLYEIILNSEADEFIRSRMCEALAMVVLRRELDRAVAGRFLRDAFMELRPQAGNYVWNGWQSAIAMLGLTELKPLVKKAFDRGFVDSHWLGFEDFERDLQHGVDHPGQVRRQNDGRYTLFSNVIEELSTWYSFSEEYREGQERLSQWRTERSAAAEPVTNPHRGVGRNDPCPCGSGKKFKRCCLQ